MKLTAFIVISFFAIILGVVLFQVKYRVAALEVELARTHQLIHDGQEAIKVLNAEWSYLTEPRRLQNLSDKFLALKSMQPAQMVSLAEVLRVLEEEARVQQKMASHASEEIP